MGVDDRLGPPRFIRDAPREDQTSQSLARMVRRMSQNENSRRSSRSGGDSFESFCVFRKKTASARSASGTLVDFDQRHQVISSDASFMRPWSDG
jgi:hypothetical protein